MSINFRPKVLSAGRKVIFLDTNIISEINKVKLGHSQDPRYIEIHDVLVEKLAAGKICLVDAMQADELAVDTRYDHVALFKSWGKGVVVMQVNILEQLHILAAMRSYLLGENDVLLPFVTKDIDFIFDRLYSNSVRDNSPKNREDLRDRLLQLRDRKTMLQEQWRLEILSVPNLILPRLESLLSRDGMNTVAAGVLMKRLGYPYNLISAWQSLHERLGIKPVRNINDFFTSDYFLLLPTILVHGYFMALDIVQDTAPEQLESGPYDSMHSVYALGIADYVLVEKAMKNKMVHSKLNSRKVELYSIADYQELVSKLKQL